MSMIHTRDLMPAYITENSRDIHTFLRLIDLAFNNEKLKSEDFISILNPDKCPNDLLPLLASYLGYEYDYNETFDRNRVVIRSYKNMMRNKGNVVGIKLAVCASISMLVNKSITEAQSLFDVAYYDQYYTCANCGYIAYESFDECPVCGKSKTAIKSDVGSIVIVIEYPKYSTKSYDLIEDVRPAGMGVKIYNGSIEEINETLGLSDFVKLQSEYLNLGNSEVGGKDSLVGFTPILRESGITFDDNTPKTKYKYCEDCGKLFLSELSECPFCGSNNVALDYNSSMRFIYRLYNTNNALSSVINAISNSIISNKIDEVGIILRIHINNNSQHWYAINDFKQSFIFALKPYININGNEYFKYNITDVLDKLVSLNDTNLSIMYNPELDKKNWSYNLVFDETTNKYGIKVGKPEVEDSDEESSVIIEYHTYYLDEDNIVFSEIDNETLSQNVLDTSDEISVQLGKDNIIIGNETHSDEYNFNGDKNENSTMKDFNKKYINVCKACNREFIADKDELLTCPYCSGVFYEQYEDKYVYNSDPTLLSGSYLLDLYFE